MVPYGMPAIDPQPPTAVSWLQSYEFLTLRSGAISHGRGEEKPKETEKLKIVARGWISRRALKGKIATIFVAVRPRGDRES